MPLSAENVRERLTLSRTDSRSLVIDPPPSDLKSALGLPCGERRVSLAPFAMKASSIWLFCRLSSGKLRLLLTTPIVRAFSGICPPTTPSADFCTSLRNPLKSPQSRFSRQPCRSPEVSSTAFGALPPDLRRGSRWMEDFAVACPLVPTSRRLVSDSCSSAHTFAPRFFRTLLTVRRPCASLTLHLQLVG